MSDKDSGTATRGGERKARRDRMGERRVTVEGEVTHAKREVGREKGKGGKGSMKCQFVRICHPC